MGFTEIKTGAVLELAAFWSDTFEQASAEASDPETALLHKSRSEALQEVGNALWRKGALSSPHDYAERFERVPFGDSAPQIKALQALSEEKRSLLIHKAWSQAARWALGRGEQSLKPDGGAPGLWDRFVQIHQGLGLGVGPNPFEAASAGQTPAMWALSGDASLIGMGIARGFDPKLQERLSLRFIHNGHVGEDSRALARQECVAALEAFRLGSALHAPAPSPPGARARILSRRSALTPWPI